MADLKSFDRVAHLYDETRGVPAEAEKQIGDGMAALLKEVSPNPWALEIGIGTGRIAVPLAERGVRVTGIDISTKMLAILRGKRTDIDVMIAEASQPPLSERSFDGAIYVHILHLVPDAEATVRATVPLMRPGGIMIEAGDDRTRTILSEADDIVMAATQELSRDVDMERSTPHIIGTDAFVFILKGAGASVETVRLAAWKGSATGRRLLERLKRRDYSSSWKIPDAIMPKLLETVTPQVKALFGDLDREVEYDRSFSARVARLPR